jgi:hypothetical protein
MNILQQPFLDIQTCRIGELQMHRAVFERLRLFCIYGFSLLLKTGSVNYFLTVFYFIKTGTALFSFSISARDSAFVFPLPER